jgi:hypothetical protein
LAVSIFDFQARVMGLHVASLTMTLDAGIVVIGGGLMDPQATTTDFRERYLRVVREAEEFPLGEGLGHGEGHLHNAVVVGEELREEEGGFVEVDQAAADAAALPDADPAVRALAVAGNNIAAALEQQPALDGAARVLMLQAAEVGLAFWRRAGTWLHEERARYRLAQSHRRAGDAASARRHARACLALVAAHGDEPLERFFGEEALGLAEAAAGDAAAHGRALAAARDAFARLTSKDGHAPQHTLVTTGTGSGKTECFLYPILDHCLRHAGTPGIKAIILYPINALATDQAGRLARLIAGDERLQGRLRAGLYVGDGAPAERWLAEHAALAPPVSAARPVS